MAISVKEDLVQGTTVESTLTQQTLTRVFLVQGLSSVAADAQALEAEGAQDSETGFTIPAMGDAHPVKPELIVSKITVQAWGNGAFKVTVMYRYRVLPAAFLQSFRASFKQVIQHQDVNGVLATVTYTPTGGSAIKQVADLKGLQLSATLSFELMQTQSPESLTTSVSGYVNSDLWRGYEPRTVLSLPVSGTTEDGVYYKNTFSFAYNPETWDEFAFYIDPSTGKVPPDVAAAAAPSSGTMSGNGWGRFQMFPATAFGTTFSFLA